VVEFGGGLSEGESDRSGIRDQNTERGMWNAERGIRNAERGIRNAERGIRNAERGIRNAEYGTQNAERRIREPEHTEPIADECGKCGKPESDKGE